MTRTRERMNGAASCGGRPGLLGALLEAFEQVALLEPHVATAVGEVRRGVSGVDPRPPRRPLLRGSATAWSGPGGGGHA